MAFDLTEITIKHEGINVACFTNEKIVSVFLPLTTILQVEHHLSTPARDLPIFRVRSSVVSSETTIELSSANWKKTAFVYQEVIDKGDQNSGRKQALAVLPCQQEECELYIS